MMTEKQGDDKNQDNTSADWMKMMTDFWSPIMGSWGTGMPGAASPAGDRKDDPGASLQSMIQMWQTLMKTAGGTMDKEHLDQTSQVVPDMLMGFAQTCLRGFTRFQEHLNQWMEKKDGDFSSMEASEAFQKEFLEGWTDAYENEFRQFLKMPQIGLGRVYQERVLEAADKYNLFQGVFSKFLHQLYVPMEEAYQRLQQQVAEHADADQVEEDPKAYYRLWVKILEEHYMTLFKKPDFSEILGQTLGALNEYSTAKQTVVNDMLKQNAIPTHDDLDEMYKEIYLLKKRMRSYEKQ